MRAQVRRRGFVVSAMVLVLFALAAAMRAPAGSKVATTVDVSELTLAPMPEGGGVPALTAVSDDPDALGALADDYEEVELLLSGVASTYSGPATGPATEVSSENPYVTRVVTRFPKSASDFSGRVFLEPFNTTAGPDRDPVWRLVAPLLQRNGDAWVGVSVRSTSVSQLQGFDAVRYAGLSIPVNDYVWDMLRQLGAVLKTGGDQSPLGKLRAEHLYVGGYSQSAVDSATFAMTFHDTARLADDSPIFDGYLIAAHAATLTPLQTGAGLITEFEEVPMQPVDVPVVDFETQHDVMGWTREFLPDFFYTSRSGASVRRKDANTKTDKYRLFEIAGASHSSTSTGDCGGAPSTFPNSPFVRGAVAKLFAWAETGKPPSKVPRIDMETIDIVSVPEVDGVGNATGGVRSPFVDVPLVQYHVQAGGSGLACAFSGTETPLPADVLADRYESVDAYMKRFTTSLDRTIAAGFVLKADRAEILASAREKAVQLLGG